MGELNGNLHFILAYSSAEMSNITRKTPNYLLGYSYDDPILERAKSSCFNSLWPSDAIWRQIPRSTLAQVMACCLTAPSHYLNQCWLIINKVQWHSSECNFTRDASAITEISLKITYLNFCSNLPGANELTRRGTMTIWEGKYNNRYHLDKIFEMINCQIIYNTTSKSSSMECSNASFYHSKCTCFWISFIHRTSNLSFYNTVVFLNIIQASGTR